MFKIINWTNLLEMIQRRWAVWAALLIALLAYRAFLAFWEDFDTIGVAIINNLAALRTHT
jgi:hypothetical protein